MMSPSCSRAGAPLCEADGSHFIYLYTCVCVIYYVKNDVFTRRVVAEALGTAMGSHTCLSWLDVPVAGVIARRRGGLQGRGATSERRIAPLSGKSDEVARLGAVASSARLVAARCVAPASRRVTKSHFCPQNPARAVRGLGMAGALPPWPSPPLAAAAPVSSPWALCHGRGCPSTRRGAVLCGCGCRRRCATCRAPSSDSHGRCGRLPPHPPAAISSASAPRLPLPVPAAGALGAPVSPPLLGLPLARGALVGAGGTMVGGVPFPKCVLLDGSRPAGWEGALVFVAEKDKRRVEACCWKPPAFSSPAAGAGCRPA